MDYHSNVFYYYGRDDSSAEGETQLENNTTKALVNTLQYLSAQLTSQFLTNLLGRQVLGHKFRFHFQSERLSGELQSAIRTANQLIVLVLTPNGHSPTDLAGHNAELFISQATRHPGSQAKIRKFLDESKTHFLVGDLEVVNANHIKKWFPWSTVDSLAKEEIFDLYDYFIRSSIPDAWIFWDRTVILVENKTRSEITRSQTLRHLKLLGKYNSKTRPDLVIRSWRKHIAECLAQLESNDERNFLINQLKNYLESINMGRLKFTYDDFLAFDELDAGQIKQLRSAHARIYNLGETMVESVLPDHRVHKQKLQASYAGINLVSNDYSERKPVQVPHYSLAVTGEFFLTVFVTFESKPLIERLIGRYRKEKKALEYRLEEVLSGVRGEDYYLRLLDKWHVTSGGRRHNRSTWFPLVDIPFDILTVIPNWGRLVLEKITSLSSAERKKKTIDKIGFLRAFGGKSVYAAVAVGKNLKWHYVHERGTDIAGDIEEAICALKPYYEFLRELIDRGPSRSSGPRASGASTDSWNRSSTSTKSSRPRTSRH